MNKYKELEDYNEKLTEWIRYRYKIKSILRILNQKNVHIQYNNSSNGIKFGDDERLNKRLKNIIVKTIEQELKLFEETSFEDWSKEIMVSSEYE